MNLFCSSLILHYLCRMQDDERKIDSYKTLKVYQKTICVFDITCYFVDHFLDRGHDRTVDQMQQAARSGKQNIVEGYSDAEGSTDSEHKLTVIDTDQTLAMLHGYTKYINGNSWNRVVSRNSAFGKGFNLGKVGVVGKITLTPLPHLLPLQHLLKNKLWY